MHSTCCVQQSEPEAACMCECECVSLQHKSLYGLTSPDPQWLVPSHPLFSLSPTDQLGKVSMKYKYYVMPPPPAKGRSTVGFISSLDGLLKTQNLSRVESRSKASPRSSLNWGTELRFLGLLS